MGMVEAGLTPCAVRLMPCALCRVPYAVYLMPYAVRRAPYAVYLMPCTLCLTPCALRLTLSLSPPTGIRGHRPEPWHLPRQPPWIPFPQ